MLWGQSFLAAFGINQPEEWLCATMGKARVYVSPSINVTKAPAQALILPQANP